MFLMLLLLLPYRSRKAFKNKLVLYGMIAVLLVTNFYALMRVFKKK
jgi:hypothetical protein